LGWLGIALHFLFFFYKIITVSWLGSRVSLVASGFFVPFLIYFFFNYILQYWVGCELRFIIFFFLLSMKITRPYDSSYGFGRLTSVDSNGFFMSFFNLFFSFYPSTLSWLRIEFHNLFQFSFYVVIQISWIRFDGLTWVNSTYFSIDLYF
jgi:hypothetical protein